MKELAAKAALLALVGLGISAHAAGTPALSGVFQKDDPPQDEPTQRIEVRGAARLEFFDRASGRLARRLVAGDLQPKGSGAQAPYEAREVRIEEFDLADGELLRQVEAAQANLVLDLSGGLAQPALGDGSKLRFEGVRVHQTRNLPHAPVLIESPVVEAVLDSGVYTTPSDHRVRVEGVGLRAEGQGLLFDGPRGIIELPGGGTVDLVHEGSTRGVLATDAGAGLVLRRMGGPKGRAFRMETLGPAILTLSGDQEAQVTAERFVVLTENSSEGARVSEVIAYGRVRVSRGADTFGGQGAKITFQPDGTSRLVIQERPVAEIGVVAAEGERRSMKLESQQGLVLRETSQGLRLRLAGPFQVVDTLGATLEVEGSGEGLLSGDRSELSLRLAGRVVFRAGETEVTSQGATIRHEALPESRLHLSAAAEVVARSRTPEGTLLELKASAAEIELAGATARVLWANDVAVRDLSSVGQWLEAGRVEDFVWDQRSFRATGGVRWLTTEGGGRADALIATGETLDATGSPGQRAELSWFAEGRPAMNLEARRIQAGATHVEAWGAVQADGGSPDQQLGISGEHLRVDLLTGEEVESLRVVAERVGELLLEEEGRLIRIGAGRIEGLSERQGDGSPWELVELQASGDLSGELAGESTARFKADRALLGPDGTLRVLADEGRLVEAEGLLPRSLAPFSLTASALDLGQELLFGQQLVASWSPPSTSEEVSLSIELRADEARFGPQDLDARGRVEVQAHAGELRTHHIQADELVVRARQDMAEAVFTWANLDLLEATGSVRVGWADRVSVRANSLRVDHARAQLKGFPLVVESGPFSFETRELGVDLVDFLLDCEGATLSRDQEWSLKLGAATRHEAGGELMQTLHGVTLEQGNQLLRANHVALWLEAGEWRSRVQEALFGAAPPDAETSDEGPPTAAAPSPAGSGTVAPAERRSLLAGAFQSLAEGRFSRALRAIHLVGSLELEQGGRRMARAEESYFDVPRERAWIREAEFSFDLAVRGGAQRVRAMTARLDSTPEGGLVAERATLTTCEFEDPHYVIQSEDLSLIPRADGRWRFGVRGNRIEFPGGLNLPLPGLGGVVLDEEGGFEGLEDEDGGVRTLQNIFLSSTARFGTAIGTEGATEFGSVGNRVAGWFGFEPDRLRGRWRYEGSWLGSRGPLLGLGLQVREQTGRSTEEEAWVDLWARGIPDDGEDRGLIRVDQADRSNPRLWFNLRGRYPFSDDEWIDIAATRQTDEGVQSEFFEREYLDYEQRDTYLHWRRADGANYLHALASVRSDPWRTDIEQQPSLGWYSGATSVGEVLGQSLLYSSSLDAAVLRRREGTGLPELPLLGVDGRADGLGERTVARIDTIHELSLPVTLGDTGLHAVPGVRLRGTAWDRDRDEATTVARGGLISGLELGGSWSRIGAGTVTLLSPYVRHERAPWSEEASDTLVRFDATEDPIGGNRTDAGLRLRWRRPSREDRFDLEAGIVRWSDLEEEVPITEEGRVLANLQILAGGMPLGLLHDGRYGLSDEGTRYSNTTFAMRPVEAFEFQVSHDRALEVPPDKDALYEAITYRGRYRIDTKWEVDLLTQDDLLGGGALRSEAILRRLGHDFVVELSLTHRAGEGSGFSINLAPLFGWRRPRVSMLPVLEP